MTAPAPPAEPDTLPHEVTLSALEEATGIDFTLLSRLRAQTLTRLSERNAQAIAVGLSWPLGSQYESWARRTYGRDLTAAALAVGLKHAVKCPGCLRRGDDGETTSAGS